MKILGIESTCDETSAGIVENGTKLIKNVVASSSDLHGKFGGIVPEVAAREQVKLLIPVLSEALKNDKDIDSIAVSYGPGLLGSLLVGVESAKILSLVWEKSLIPVNHLFGHVFACWIEKKKVPKFPLVALIVSGGHTDLLYMKSAKKFKWLGGTRDDAAGESFDKIARIIRLGYPGGPEIEKSAKEFDGKLLLDFPKPMINSNDFDFSFSGLKTYVSNIVSKKNVDSEMRNQISFGVQNAIVEVLVKKSLKAVKKFKVNTIVVGGGVSANNYLKETMKEVMKANSVKVIFPEKNLSTDNGAMIAAAAYYMDKTVEPLDLQADPSLYFD